MLFVFTCFSCAGAEKKEMKVSEIIKLMKSGKPVQVIDKIIVGDLDFTAAGEPFIVNGHLLQCEIQSNIYFENCVFMGKVTSNGKRGENPVRGVFRNNLVLTGCDFRGEVDFEGAILFGMINFSRSTFRERANFNNITVWAKDNYFQETTAEKEFSMIYASIAGNLHMQSSEFGGNAAFQMMIVRGALMFNFCSFSGRVGLDRIEVGDNAFFNNAKFNSVANFANSRFMNRANFASVIFEDRANFERTFFLNAVNFDGVNRNNLNLTNATFITQ